MLGVERPFRFGALAVARASCAHPLEAGVALRAAHQSCGACRRGKALQVRSAPAPP
jgi:hypothetical protein